MDRDRCVDLHVPLLPPPFAGHWLPDGTPSARDQALLALSRREGQAMRGSCELLLRSGRWMEPLSEEPGVEHPLPLRLCPERPSWGAGARPAGARCGPTLLNRCSAARDRIRGRAGCSRIAGTVFLVTLTSPFGRSFPGAIRSLDRRELLLAVDGNRVPVPLARRRGTMPSRVDRVIVFLPGGACPQRPSRRRAGAAESPADGEGRWAASRVGWLPLTQPPPPHGGTGSTRSWSTAHTENRRLVC